MAIHPSRIKTMKTDLWVVIPTADRSEYIPEIVAQCGVPRNKIIIISTSNTFYPDVCNIDSYELNIYKWWNDGIRYAKKRGATHVAILNDDVVLKDRPLQEILKVMVQEDATIGYPLPASSDPCGYCFILNLEHGVFPDDKYRWWYGDNDLYERANKVVGVKASVKHMEPNRLTSESPGLMALTRFDKVRWEQRELR